MVDSRGSLQLQIRNAIGEYCTAAKIDARDRDDWERGAVDVYGARHAYTLGTCYNFRVPYSVISREVLWKNNKANRGFFSESKLFQDQKVAIRFMER